MFISVFKSNALANRSMISINRAQQHVRFGAVSLQCIVLVIRTNQGGHKVCNYLLVWFLVAANTVGDDSYKFGHVS